MSRNTIVIRIEACNVYRYLLKRGYSEKAALALVGDRHRLSRLERNCLFRATVDPAIAASRHRKIVARNAVRGRPLGGALRAVIPGAPGEVVLAASADGPQKRYQGIVASSDSMVMDAAAEVIDLPRRALGRRCGFSPPPLDRRRSP